MSKIYGYKEEDVISLAEYLKERKGRSLSETFASYGETCGKAKGTVRNLYYAIAKLSKTDGEFCQKYLDGKPLSVGKIESFSAEEEKEIVKKILSGRRDGRSVRGVIMELAEGNGKLALRYQNKFRSAVKNKPHLIAEVIKEIKDEGKESEFSFEKKEAENAISEKQMERLKSEINALVGKIATKTKKENERLKERVATLEKENLRLSALLYGADKKPGAVKYFRTRGREEYLN